MTKLLELERKFDELSGEAHTHWSKEEQRMQLVDQFINPAMDLDSLLRQMVDALERHRKMVAAVEQEVRRLTGAVELHLSDPGTTPAAREVNGKH